MEVVEIQHDSDQYFEAVQLRDRLLRKPLGLGFTQEQLAAERSDRHFAIVDTGKIVACVVVVPLSETHAKVRQMVVDDACQQKGHGTKLILTVEALLEKETFVSLELNARAEAIAFYERLGYTCQGEEFIEVSIPHRKMTKSIGKSA